MLPRPPGQGSGAAGVRGRKQMVRMEVVKELKARIFNITQGLIAKQQKSFEEIEQKPTLFFFVFPWNEEVRCEPCHQEIDVCGFASQFILRDNYASSDNFIFIFQTWNPCLLQLLREQSRTINCTYAFIRRRQNVSAPRAEVRKLLCKGQDRHYFRLYRPCQSQP